MSNVIPFALPVPTDHGSITMKVEVFACTNCKATDHFRLHVDGGVVCTACNIWQPVAVFEPNVKE